MEYIKELKNSISYLRGEANTLRNNLNEYVENKNIESEQFKSIRTDLDTLIINLGNALN